MNKIIKLTFLFTLLVKISFAQEGKIETDRPDQTETPFLTPKNWIQLEAGFNIQQNIKNSFEYLSPTLLSKIGITKKIELRLITTVVTNKVKGAFSTFTQTGLAPVEIGAKVFISEEKKAMPKTSLIFHFALPKFSSKSFQSNKVAPNFRFVMQNTLSKTVGLGYNIGAEWDGFTNTPTWIYTFAPGFTLSEKWYGYIEAFGFINKNESPQHSIDGGLGYFLNDNIKLDVSSGFGISEAAPNWYFSLGGSVRFKTTSK
jgi:Putative MetA-pathway of phenol degradation